MHRPIIINFKNEDIVEYIKEHAGIYENKETKEQIKAIYMDTLAIMHIDYKSQVVAKFPIRYPENDPVVAVNAFNYLTPDGKTLTPEEIKQNYHHIDKMNSLLDLFNIKTYRISNSASLSLGKNYNENNIIEKLKEKYSYYKKLAPNHNVIAFKMGPEFLLLYPTIEPKTELNSTNYHNGTTIVRCYDKMNLLNTLNSKEMKMIFDYLKIEKHNVVNEAKQINENTTLTHEDVVKNIRLMKEKIKLSPSRKMDR